MTRLPSPAGLAIQRRASAAHPGTTGTCGERSLVAQNRSFLDFWKMRSLTTMTCSSSPPRPRPPLLKIGALRPQWPQMYPPNFQRLKLVPSTTRSRHPPPALYRVPGQLTEPSRRQSSCFLQCSPSPCTLPGHSLGHIRVHEPPCQQASGPPRPPLLRNATSGDMWGEGTRYEFLPGPHVSPRHITQRSARPPRP